MTYYKKRTELSWLTFYSEELDEDYLILDPRAFEASATSPKWIDIEGCVWRGPVNLLHKMPLASVSQYRDNKTLVRFFRQILGVEDANWSDYRDMLWELKKNSNLFHDIDNKVLRLYQLFSKIRLSNNDWAEIRQAIAPPQTSYQVLTPTPQWFLRG